MSKGSKEDVLVLAQHLVLSEVVREIEERQFAYQSEKKAARELAIKEYTAHLPRVREILERGKR